MDTDKRRSQEKLLIEAFKITCKLVKKLVNNLNLKKKFVFIVLIKSSTTVVDRVILIPLDRSILLPVDRGILLSVDRGVLLPVDKGILPVDRGFVYQKTEVFFYQ